MPTEIDTVVFDVGRVLVDFNYALFFRSVEQHYGVRIEDPLSFLCANGLLEHEHGRLSGPDFLTGLAAAILCSAHRPTANLPIDPVALHHYWIDIFEPLESMGPVLETLRSRYRVYLLSNAGELHWRHVAGRFTFLQSAHGVLTSFEAGVMKPDPRIYQLAEERFGLIPGRTVFIDDKRENVEAALGRGWHGIVHVSPELTRSELGRLGVTVL